MASASVLPSIADATSAPGAAATVVKGLVHESLKEEWRCEHRSGEFLAALHQQTLVHLDALDAKELEQDHEEACAVCLKLARNLSVGCPHTQEFWWDHGLVKKLTEVVRLDVHRTDQRGAAWCEALPSFLCNSVTGHSTLRQVAFGAWFPYELAAACSLCWRRPELAFMLVQNLAGGKGSAKLFDQMICTEDGHCILFILLSLLCQSGVSDANAPVPKVWEWATLLLHSLWMAGGFAAAYRGVKRLTATRLHTFLGQMAQPLTISDEESTLHESAGPPAGLGCLVGRLCGQAEALSLLWHSLDGLLGGPLEGMDGRNQESNALACQLLEDSAFINLLAEELAGTISRLTHEWQLDWHAERPPAEACDTLGIEATELDPLTLASRASAAGGLQSGGRAATALLFGDLCAAASALLVSAHAAGIPVPPLVAGTCLVVNISCLDALHRHRFGALGGEVVASQPSRLPLHQEAAEAARACHLLDQLRLVGNVLYENRSAQDFLGLSGGLRVLLSFCYADPDLPLLRENGIFAVRSATHGHVANQTAARALLAERKAAPRETPPMDELGLSSLGE